MINQTEQQERQHLQKVISRLQHYLETLETMVQGKNKELMEHKSYLWDNYSELDRAEKSSLREIVTRSVASGENALEKRKKIRKLISIPYFGRIDFCETGATDEQPVYLGIHAFYDSENNENLIHDWRAPISSMFYDYELGEASYEAPSGTVSGCINLKRQFRIRNSKMELMLDTSLNIQDDVLQKELSTNSDDRMKNIVATIQREQNRIIRNDDAHTLIIQGVAGSGKTSIALHRVAYLLYKYNGEITSKDILIISPNKVFADYISNVLPELGEEKIEECGFEELMSAMLEGKYKYQTYFEQVTELLEGKDKSFAERIAFKASDKFCQMIEKFVLHVEQNYFAAEDVMVGKIPVPASYIDERYKAYHRLPVRGRTESIANDIINEITLGTGAEMPRPERTKLIKAIAKMLKGSNDLNLYKDFYEWAGCPEMFKLKKGRTLEYVDMAALLYMKVLLEGCTYMQKVKHLLVDEMQDYSALQYKLLTRIFNCRKTILGDAQQSVNPLSSTDYERISRAIPGSTVMKLCKSYRSTYEITDFAQRIRRNDELEVIERHGDKPVCYTLDSVEQEDKKMCDIVTDFFSSEFASMGVVCKTQSQAEVVYETLKHLSDHVCLLTSESAAFVNGVVVTTAHLAKGLEFDVVLVPRVSADNYREEIDRNMLYIACTRAMHRLYLTSAGKLSDFVS